MSFLDIFKKKKKGETGSQVGIEKEKGKEKERDEKKQEKKEKEQEKKEKREKLEEKSFLPETKKEVIFDKAYRVLEMPHITEKSTKLNEEDKYVFKVFQKANKNEIKKAIEGLYGVEVIKVRTINIPKKSKRLGARFGWKKGYKKAIVTIKKGQKIEIMPR